MTNVKSIKEYVEKKKKLARDSTEKHLAGNICINIECKLRKAGCRGSEGCPGFKSKD